MIITHPNRDKPVVQATRATVIVLLPGERGAGADRDRRRLERARGRGPGRRSPMSLVYLLLAFYAGRWNRGVLPVALRSRCCSAIFAAGRGPGLVRTATRLRL